MGSKFWPKWGLPGILHHYVRYFSLYGTCPVTGNTTVTDVYHLKTESLVTFEYTSHATSQPHSIIFVGGLSDGLGTSSFTSDIVEALQGTRWSFFTLNLTSSYQSWGLGHLDRDTDEIAQCIRYVMEYKTAIFGGDAKVVLVGHSTGSQCVLHYLCQPNPHTSVPVFDPDLEHERRLAVDGAIMLAPISDREAIHSVLDEGIGDNSAGECRKVYDELIGIAKKAICQDKKWDTILPLSLTSQLGYGPTTPISARRFLSLASPDSPQSPGEDDYFSADLSDEQLSTTFGAIQQRALLKNKLMVAPSGADQAVPAWIDKERNLSRWETSTDHNGKFRFWDQKHSGVIPGASHAFSNDDQAEPRRILAERVISFLQIIES
ncbi:UPF0613 protein PB24D3.06c 2 [Seiridium cupressi]